MYILFSQCRSCDVTLESCFFEISSYSRGVCTHNFMKRQKANPFGNITWPTLGKQNVQAKEVYCLVSIENEERHTCSAKYPVQVTFNCQVQSALLFQQFSGPVRHPHEIRNTIFFCKTQLKIWIWYTGHQTWILKVAETLSFDLCCAPTVSDFLCYKSTSDSLNPQLGNTSETGRLVKRARAFYTAQTQPLICTLRFAKYHIIIKTPSSSYNHK